jgi:SSS family solute:Na+ symporter
VSRTFFGTNKKSRKGLICLIGSGRTALLESRLFAFIGSGAGLALGISAIISNDLVKAFSKKVLNPIWELRLSRLYIVIILALGTVFSVLLGDELIQTFAYMSMSLRGTVLFMPLMLALFARSRVNKRCIMISITVSPTPDV